MDAINSRLLLVAGAGHLGMYPLVAGHTLVIGRSSGSDVLLSHPRISRRHAFVHAAESGVYVEDAGSKNGMRLAGRRLGNGKPTPIEPGSNLMLGPYVAVVVAAPDPQRVTLSVVDPTPNGVSDVIARVALAGVNVLITGETGVGKEVLARTLHELSGRAGKLAAFDCARLSEALLESDFAIAGGGTVFLDEIAELPAALQAKLVRVLDKRLDVRFLAATQREDEVARGGFRIVLAIEPLRARRNLIPRLAEELLASAVAPGTRPPRLGGAALDLLLGHDWPGNVRELRAVMERAALLCEGDEILPAHILLDRTHGS